MRRTKPFDAPSASHVFSAWGSNRCALLNLVHLRFFAALLFSMALVSLARTHGLPKAAVASAGLDAFLSSSHASLSYWQSPPLIILNSGEPCSPGITKIGRPPTHTRFWDVLYDFFCELAMEPFSLLFLPWFWAACRLVAFFPSPLQRSCLGFCNLRGNSCSVMPLPFWRG